MIKRVFIFGNIDLKNDSLRCELYLATGKISGY